MAQGADEAEPSPALAGPTRTRSMYFSEKNGSRPVDIQRHMVDFADNFKNGYRFWITGIQGEGDDDCFC